MDLSIIIVNYKSKGKLINCLKSIEQSDFQNFSWELIVVENNSGDNLSDVKSSFPIKFIFSEKNLGMGGGNNLGINLAQGNHVLILNPDTVLSVNTISSLLEYYQADSNLGVIGPKLLNPDQSLQYSCFQFPSFFMPVLRRTFLGKYFSKHRDEFMMQEVNHNQIQEVDWLLGSCLLFKRELIDAQGNKFQPKFDERYFMYFEDIDLCRTIKSKGFKVVYYPKVHIIHDHARLSAKHPWYKAIFLSKISRTHILSWFKYFLKWGLH